MNAPQKKNILNKLINNTFNVDDLDEYFQIFVNVSNHSDLIKEEVENWDKVFQINITDKCCYTIEIKEQKFRLLKEKIEKKDILIELDSTTATAIITGNIEPSELYMNNSLIIEGSLPDSIKFRTICEIVREEIEE